MRNISFLIKPASGKCNMNCKYCFYSDEMEHREIRDLGNMTVETSVNIIEKALVFADGGHITFAFQGGEPTVRGLDFYRKFIENIKTRNSKKSNITYAIQTNGLLIDEEWAEFFHENKFLVGVSLDGTRDLHDMNRIDMKNKGTYKKVMDSIDILERKKVDFNILTVINRTNSKKILKIYNLYKKNGFNFMQFIPCLEPIGENMGGSKYALTSDDYEIFLKTLFNAWYKDVKEGKFISIRYFDNLLGMYMGKEPESCDMRGMCSVQNVIEADGSVYSCDFYVMDDYEIGNINEMSIEEIVESDKAKEFVESSLLMTEDCKNCKWLNICRGGCRRHKTDFGADDVMKNYFCKAFYNFHEYSYDKFRELAQMVASRR